MCLRSLTFVHWISTDSATNNFMKVLPILSKDAAFFWPKAFKAVSSMVIVFLIPDTFSFNLVVIVRKTFNQKRIKMCNVFLTLRPLPHFTNILFSVSCLVLKSDPAKLCRNVTIFTQNILSFFVFFLQNTHQMKMSNFAESPSAIITMAVQSLEKGIREHFLRTTGKFISV